MFTPRGRRRRRLLDTFIEMEIEERLDGEPPEERLQEGQYRRRLADADENQMEDGRKDRKRTA
jgi:hypothetical protein